VGETKLRAHGAAFLEEIAAHLRTNARQIFADDSFKSVAPTAVKKTRGELMNDTVRETLKLFRAGVEPEDIARNRDLAAGTIYGHLASALEAGETLDFSRLFSEAERKEIEGAFAQAGWGTLSGAHTLLGGRFDYGRLRLFRAARSGK
jgi:ATP-dependent DNA helicase RecQ